MKNVWKVKRYQPSPTSKCIRLWISHICINLTTFQETIGVELFRFSVDIRIM